MNWVLKLDPQVLTLAVAVVSGQKMCSLSPAENPVMLGKPTVEPVTFLPHATGTVVVLGMMQLVSREKFPSCVPVLPTKIS